MNEEVTNSPDSCTGTWSTGHYHTDCFTVYPGYEQVYKEAKKYTEFLGAKRRGHPRFYELLEEIAELHDRKNADYSDFTTDKKHDPFANFRLSEHAGIKAWKGVLVRMSDKMSRLFTFAKKERFEVSEESVKDTLKDLAVYALIALILYEEDVPA